MPGSGFQRILSREIDQKKQKKVGAGPEEGEWLGAVGEEEEEEQKRRCENGVFFPHAVGLG